MMVADWTDLVEEDQDADNWVTLTRPMTPPDDEDKWDLIAANEG
jgi:hypothetical protein